MSTHPTTLGGIRYTASFAFLANGHEVVRLARLDRAAKPRYLVVSRQGGRAGIVGSRREARLLAEATK